MAEINFPFKNLEPYSRTKSGLCGNLGEGANANIMFIQTVISPDELKDITLISNIPGSETWNVSDLFQRDVDDWRVENQILPYFKDNSKVKFFNPLTLIILPLNSNSKEIIKEIEYIKLKEEKDGDNVIKVYEKDGFYRLSIYDGDESFGRLKWNDHKCFLVAIDGQHRLSALKRWQSDPNGNFSNWKIPVVILNIFKVDKDKKTANLLEIVRKTFVYINTKAERVNKAREILLNDESVNAICTQELIQDSHVNDNKPSDKRNAKTVPLMFYDWRGDALGNNRVSGSLASIKSLEEIHSWFEHYLLGEDGKCEQETQLLLTDLIPPLDNFEIKNISYKDSRRIREQFKKTLLPGISYFLQNFKPYAEYIKYCREIEKQSIEKSDNANHAFHYLRFGSHNAPKDQDKAVNEEFHNLIDKFTNIKYKLLPDIISKDIGLRGIMYAFGKCKEEYENILNQSIEWAKFSILFTDIINDIYNDNWFVKYEQLSKEKRKILTHLIFDEYGTVINYKLEHAESALGALIVILVIHRMFKAGNIDNIGFINIYDEQSNIIRKTVERGFRKSIKAELQEAWTGSINEFNLKVKNEAEKSSNNYIKKLSAFLELK